MEQNGLKLMPVNYTPPEKLYWTGRYTKPELGSQYWHQEIELIDFNRFQQTSKLTNKPDIALLGYACDEGVRRNLGRIGAKKGPNAFRQRLAQLSFHHEKKQIADFGNVVCEDGNMEASQTKLSSIVNELMQHSIFPIIIGGGHDVAYGHFKGLLTSLKGQSTPKIGIVNFDAHFDLRPLEGTANSGTPFYQILEEHKDIVEYLALGIQQQSNTKELFDIAQQKKVNYVLNYDCDAANFDAIMHQLDVFVERNDYLYITIDLDGFSSAYAPGVSAPSPLGFTPYFVLKVMRYLLETKKVVSCDLAELNPDYDRDNATANLAARIVDFIVEFV